MSESLIDIYNARIAEGKLTPDAAQVVALPELERVLHELAHRPATPPRGGLRGLFAKAPEPARVRGLYLWGGVGRGKSMLMDMFFEAVRTERKRRVHFHAFMQEIHAGLHEARKRKVADAILPVAEEVIAHVDLLCFDEMQISDIADAMIVGRLFERLFAAGVVVVTTSNRVPDDLYKDGLQRELFLPFIEMIKDRMVVHELVAGRDFRQDRLAGSPVYFTPNDHAAREAIQAIWDDLSGGDAPPLVLTIKARPVEIPAFRNGVARAGFFDLCGHPLGPADYLAIADVARVLVLTDIPCLGRSNFNEAKRFVTLIDALYEAKRRLICSAAAEPEMLYLEGEGSFEFERTASRLREMQAADWSTAQESVAASC
ncbi:cell division protein ZapE [Tropicimonas sp. IMCC6043]|uniref:cell division protein ZapE n=1 Tax=Tropicimonas sp. IMCC6043 TaxID=2510645 RepID=UPI00101B682C|nr:cell division protein ZapE [Tropicimonas sp. IMCC6043]RYH10957.1 cell division protein ZapE [Tropicimonas sp. IMCC6043]